MKHRGKIVLAVALFAVAAFVITPTIYQASAEDNVATTTPAGELTAESYGTFIYDSNGNGAINASEGDIKIAAGDIQNLTNVANNLTNVANEYHQWREDSVERTVTYGRFSISNGEVITLNDENSVSLAGKNIKNVHVDYENPQNYGSTPTYTLDAAAGTLKVSFPTAPSTITITSMTVTYTNA